MVKYLNVGKVVNAQSIKGEVCVISATGFPEGRYRKEALLTLFRDGKVPIKLTVKSHRKHRNFDLLGSEGHPSINGMEEYRDGILKVSKSNSVDLDENEFYYHEVTGLCMMEEDGTKLGKVKEVLSPGTDDIWVVQHPKKVDILLLYIASIAKEVDLEAGVTRVEIPEGLIDDED